jgi:hypothetical protein|tara:strand:+ start:59 stop:649 length:591 start_codon:yes stop_codon:yes gene_type:complete
MNYEIYILIAFIIVPLGVLFAYYKGYKQNKTEFKASVKTLGKGIFKGLATIGFLIGLNQIYELIIPINKKNGIEYNSEREKLGIPKIGENWENRKYQSEQFTTYWWKTEKKDGHFKKIVQYGILNAKSETDYYRNESKKGTYAWSKYNFGNNTFEYFIEKPNDKNDSITYKGKYKMEKPTILNKINKAEFEKFVIE